MYQESREQVLTNSLLFSLFKLKRLGTWPLNMKGSQKLTKNGANIIKKSKKKLTFTYNSRFYLTISLIFHMCTMTAKEESIASEIFLYIVTVALKPSESD